MARCLVTGGLGFVGSNLVDQLIEDGHSVIVIDNLSTGTVKNKNPKAETIIADIQDEYSLKELPVVDYVFHTAALARIPRSIEDPIGSNDANVNGTLQLLEYCRKVDAKMIFSSSSSIYDGLELPTDEDDDKDPKNPYALQKYICEMWIQLYGALYNIDWTILRYFNVYGERQITEGAYAAIVGIFLQQRKEGKPLTITNDGEQRRDFTYVKDVVQANVMAMDWPQDFFNIGAGNNYSVNQLADAVGGEKKYIGERIGEVRETYADNSKAQALGWKPTMDIIEWINNAKN